MTGNRIDVSVGKCLRTIRFQRNRTVADLSAAIGVKADDLLAFESGEQRIGAHLMSKLCDALDVSAFEFFSWRNQSSENAPALELDAAQFRGRKANG